MSRVGMVAALALFFSACAPAIQERVRDYNEAGVEHFQKGEYDRAREDFQAALTIQPRDTELLFKLGQCYDSMGQSERAEQIYRGCLQQEPDHAACRHALHVLLVKRGRVAEAQNMVQGWLASRPKLSTAYAEDGWLYEQEGDPFKAIKRYQQAIYYDPHNTQALIEIGRIYEEKLNDPSRALHLYQTALDYDPHQPDLVKRVNRLRAQGVGPPRPES
jgi:tetratricopeptide (TPR) repeat protein